MHICLSAFYNSTNSRSESFYYSTPLIHVLTFYNIVDAQQELNVTLITVIECEGTRLVLI